MSHDLGPDPVSPTPDPVPVVDAQPLIDEYLLGDRGAMASVGTILAAVAACLFLWPHLPHNGLIVWVVCMVVSAAGALAVTNIARLRRPVDRRGTPWFLNASAAVTGSIIGSLVWIDRTALDHLSVRMLLVAVLMGVCAGAVGGRAGVTGLGAWTFMPMMAIAIAGFVTVGHLDLAAVLVAFAAFMVYNLRETTGILQEVIVLRERARGAAETAELAARHDPLTGVLNRSGLEMVKNEAGSDRVTALFVDLDRFKTVNDTFGHAFGDRLLVEVAERLRRIVRSDDKLARIGGDEFLLLSFGCYDVDAQNELAERIVAELERPFDLGEHLIDISASVGMAEAQVGSGVSLDELQSRADQALYVAKESGRSQSVRFDSRMKEIVDARAAISSRMRDGLAGGEIRAWGQPVVDVTTGKAVGVELLARWHHPSGSVQVPDGFLPLLEKQGLAWRLDELMLETQADVLGRWAEDPLLRTLPVSVNLLSPDQMTGDLISGLVMRSGGTVDPSRLLVEVDVGGDGWPTRDLDKHVRRLAAMGVGVVLDELGRNLSVASLLELPASFVKFSSNTLERLAARGQQTQRLAALTALLDQLSVTPVAKRVEGVEQRDLLAAGGISHMQGHLFCGPLEQHDLEDWLRVNARNPGGERRSSTVGGSSWGV